MELESCWMDLQLKNLLPPLVEQEDFGLPAVGQDFHRWLLGFVEVPELAEVLLQPQLVRHQACCALKKLELACLQWPQDLLDL